MEFVQSVWDMIKESNILDLVKALLILLVGWIISVFIKKMVYTSLKKIRLGQRIRRCMPDEEDGSQKELNIERFISLVVFWILFLLTVIASLSSLNLEKAATPISGFVETVVGFLPNVIAAGLLLFVAWLSATILRYFALTALTALQLDEKIESAVDTSGKECKLSFSIAATLYWLVFLCFLPSVLNALKITGITEMIERMLGKVFEFLPNLAMAIGVGAIGLLVASILRKLVVRFILSVNVDFLVPKDGTGGTAFEMKNIAHMLGIVVYALIAIPVVITALTSLKLESLTGSVTALFDKVLAVMSNVFLALLVLFIAYVAGKFICRLISQLLHGFGFDRFLAELGLAVKETTDMSLVPSVIVGRLTLVGIMLFAFMSAFEIVGLAAIASIIAAFLPFAGNVLIAIIVFMIGLYLANLAALAVRNKGFESQIFSFALRLVILFFAGAIALQTTGIGSSIVLTGFALIVGAVAVAFAIAFGLGGRDWAAKKLEEWSKKD